MDRDKKSVTKSIVYRRFSASPAPGQTLQQLMGSALKSRPKPGERFEPLNAGSTEIRCIGSHKTVKGCLCGYLTAFERGAAQPAIADDSTAQSLRLSAILPPAPRKGSAQQQYVPGVLYFAVRNNHVALAQSMSMRGAAFETHLNWLLKSRTSTLPATTSMVLSDEAQKATKAKIKKSHVRSISIGQPLMTTVTHEQPVHSQDASPSKGSKKSAVTSRFKPGGPMLEVLRTMFDSEEEFAKLGLDEVFDGNLEVWVQIRYPKFSRVRPKDSARLMDTLGLALRDIEGDQVALELADGSKVEGKELKISGAVEVETLQHNLPDEDQLYVGMADWLESQIENGVVDP